MKLSASLYSNKSLSLVDAAKELEPYQVDYWHIDTIEDLSVFEDIDRLAITSNIPVDIHIISASPQNYLPYLHKPIIRRISFQIEQVNEDFTFPTLIEKEMGLAIQITHPDIVDIISRYEHQVDFVLLMMTTPGISGGSFRRENFSLIRRLVNQFPNLDWCIDGGVNHEISYILRLIGVQSIVVGSYLMNHRNMAEAILNIRSNYVRSEYQLADFQIPLEQLPIVYLSDNVTQLLQKVNDYKLGIAFCIDNDGKLVGIVSNADIRKVLLQGNFSYQMGIEPFINNNPKRVIDTQTTADMIDLIYQTPFPILILPIVNKDEKLTGAISFHKLLKEE